MTLEQGTFHMFVILLSLACIPPLLSLMACTRRRARVVQRGGAGIWPLIGMVFSVAALLVNLAILNHFGVGHSLGSLDLGRFHMLALLLSWVCFWIWIVIAVGFRRRRVIF